MASRNSSLALLIPLALLAAAPVLADDPIKDVIDREVPTMKDGTRMAMSEIERSILDACARRHFKATVVAPGLIVARWERRGHFFEVTIPHSDQSYSIRYKDSERMDYNPAKRRIDDAYNEYVDGLKQHIDADFERVLERMKRAHKNQTREVRKAPKINPRTAV
jgi:hypothetical protein